MAYIGVNVDSSGNLSGTPTDNYYGNDAFKGKSDTITCPGTGSDLYDVTELGAYGHHTFSAGSGNPKVSIAIYRASDKRLEAECATAISPPTNGSDAWQTTSSVNQYHQLVGGTDYVLALSQLDEFRTAWFTGASDASDLRASTNYTTGFPDPWPADTFNSVVSPALRAQITTSSPGSPTLTGVTPSSAYANADVSVKLVGVSFTGTSLDGSGGAFDTVSGFTFSNLSVAGGGGSLTVDITIAAGQAPGSYGFTFTTTDGTSNSQPFIISDPASGGSGRLHSPSMRGGFIN